MSGAASTIPTPALQGYSRTNAGSIGRMLRRGWWIAPPVFGLALASAAFFTARQEPVHRATTMLVVTPNTQVEGIAELMRGLETLEHRAPASP